MDTADNRGKVFYKFDRWETGPVSFYWTLVARGTSSEQTIQKIGSWQAHIWEFNNSIFHGRVPWATKVL